MEPTQMPESHGSLLELMKQRTENLYTQIEAIERSQKKFRHNPTNVIPKKKKRKKK